MTDSSWWECQPMMTELEIDEIIEYVEADPMVIMEFLRMRVKAEFDKNVSRSILSHHLEGRYFTVKKLSHQPVDMNTLQNRLKKTLRRNLEMTQTSGRDEIYVNIFCIQTMSRSLKGSIACITMINSLARNIHLIGAMPINGIAMCEKRVFSK